MSKQPVMVFQITINPTEISELEGHLFVDTNGYCEPDSSPSPVRTAPTFLTDSAELAPYLHSARFRTEGHPREGGVEIRVFDVLQEQE